MNRSPVGVDGGGRHASDQCARSGPGQLGAELAHGLPRRRGVGRVGQRALDEDAAVHDRGLGRRGSGRAVGSDAVLGDGRRAAGRVGAGHAHCVDAGGVQQHVGDRLELVLIRHDLDGAARPSREVLAERDLPVARLGGSQHQLRGGHAVGLELSDAEGPHEQDDGGDGPDRAGPPPQQAGHPGPRAGGGRAPVGSGALGRIARSPRPEGGASAQDQDRGQEREGRCHGEGDADRGDRSQRAVRLQIGQGQGEQPGDDRSARGQDGLDGAPEGLAAGVPRVPVHPQLLAVAGDEEQGVVRGRTDHEDEQDPLGLAAQQQDPPPGEPPYRQQGGAQGEHAGCQHGDRQQDGAVDEQEDDEHHHQGDPQEQAVDSGEGPDEVGGQAGRAGEVDGDSLGRVGAQVLGDGAGRLGDVAPGVDGHEDLYSHPVLGGQRGRGRLHPLDLRQPADLLADLVELSPAQGAVCDENRDRGHRVGAGELAEQVLDPGGIGGLRQEGGLVVGGDLRDPSEIGSSDPRNDQPRHHEHGGQQDAQPPGRARLRGARRSGTRRLVHAGGRHIVHKVNLSGVVIF